MLHRRHLASLSLLSLIVGGSLVGCGGDEPTPPTSSSSSSSSSGTGGQGGGSGGQGGQGGGSGGQGGTGGSGGQGGQGGGTGGQGGEGGTMCVPTTEVCGDNLDNDCDGQVDEGCACAPGETKPCYTGPMGSQGIGVCMPGVQTCAPDGTGFGPCVGEILPSAEVCGDGMDQDCNGQLDDGGCVCAPGAMSPCYSGPMGTQNVGTCKGGTATCAADGMSLGPCVGEVLPAMEVCNALDDDCDGMADDAISCVCMAGSTKACYSGPMGTQGVGACKAGTQTCAADGSGYGPCVGEVLPQLENCATTADDDCNGMAPNCLGDSTWIRNGGNNQSQISWAVATDKQGNGVIAGQFNGTINLGGGNSITSAGSSDIFVIKYDPAGTVLWIKKFGDASAQRATGVAFDSAGNVIVIGDYQGTVNFGGTALTTAGGTDIFVAKLSAAGAHVWSSSFGNTFTQQGLSVAVDAADNIYVSGANSGALTLGTQMVNPLFGSLIEGLVFKMASDGSVTWAKGFGGTNSQYVNEIAVNALGDIAIAGEFDDTIDISGTTLTSGGGRDLFIAKLDTMGNHVFSKRAGDAADQRAFSVAIDAAGNVAATGEFNGAIDIGAGSVTSADIEDGFVVKYGPTGTYLWSRIFGGMSAQRGQGVAFDSFGNLLMTGQFWGSTDFGLGMKQALGGNHDVFFVKYDPTGKAAWVKSYGGTNEEDGLAITADINANVWVTGFFSSNMTFGTGTLINTAGGGDFFLLKAAP